VSLSPPPVFLLLPLWAWSRQTTSLSRQIPAHVPLLPSGVPGTAYPCQTSRCHSSWPDHPIASHPSRYISTPRLAAASPFVAPAKLPLPVPALRSLLFYPPP